MRHKNHELMENILSFIDQFYLDHDRMPSTREIGEPFEIARSTVHSYLTAMNTQGMLKYRDGVITTEFTAKISPLGRLCPVYTMNEQGYIEMGPGTGGADETN